MADSAKQQLLEDVRTIGVITNNMDADKYDIIAEGLYSAVEQEKWGLAEQKLEELMEEEGWDLEDELDFLRQIKDPGEVKKIDEEDIKQDMPHREELLLERQLKQTEGDELLLHTDKSVGIGHIFNLQEGFYRNTGKTAFIISNQREWDGRISVELSSTRKKFELMSVYEDKDGGLHFKHFGQNNPNKGYNKKEDLSKSFYQYKFVADDKEYLALSTEKLDTVRCKLKGMKISLNDYKTVGEFSKVAVNQDIIFVQSVEPAIDTMNDSQLQSYREQVDHDFLAEKLLGGWRQPEWFETFLLSQMMVNDENGYPSHLIWLAKPGTGKSKVVESILKSMDEAQPEPFTGSGSTVKGLVPSFKESTPEEGYLLKTQRVAGVDEKMDLLSNSIKQGNDAANDVFRPLLNLLTHDVRKFESGNGSIRGQMMSTMLATGNFNAYGIKDMKQLAEKIDTAYLSRTIIYSQTDSHVDFINRRKSKIKQRMQDEGITEADLFPERDDEFISLMDTMREDKKGVIDFIRVEEIHRELMEVVPGYMREIFQQRGCHHMENILLGITKYKWLTDNSRESFEAEDEDYEMLKRIFELIISGWDNVNIDKLSFDARKEALTPAQRQVFNVINDEPGIEGVELDEKTDVKSLSWCLTGLKKNSLIAVDDEKKYWPYWSDYAREKREKEKEDVIYE